MSWEDVNFQKMVRKAQAALREACMEADALTLAKGLVRPAPVCPPIDLTPEGTFEDFFGANPVPTGDRIGSKEGHKAT